MKKILLALCCAALFATCKEPVTTGKVVELTTSLGKIKVRLYDETPLHRDNFLSLVERGVYDSLLFHRVIRDFMIQAGDPSSRHTAPGKHLGEASEGEDVPAEILPGFFHKRGALAAARQGDQQNPERRSSGSQFYLVQGEVFSPAELENLVRGINDSRRGEIYRALLQKNVEKYQYLETANNPAALDSLNARINATCDSLFNAAKLILSDEQTSAYTTLGGSPHLDGAYTVFGEVISGLEVIDKIAAVPVDAYNRPLEDVRIVKARVIR
ncbi:MAG: peptidylprolyl isomerase [Odoribacteraceae bacterium]|nr:peptidylprolyl isomerase [Odoribacteraceae bacterium]